MNKLLVVVVGLLCLATVAHAEVIAPNVQMPDALIEKTVQEVFAIIKQDKDIQSGNQKKILALVDAKVLPHFDFERMTKLAMGKHWRTAAAEQQRALVTEFRNMLVRTYTKVFTVYRDQRVEVKPLKAGADTADEATVKTVITKPGSQPILVDYEMKKSDSGWKVFDISIEGVSMVMSYRGTFSTQIQQGGIDGLIRTLADKNANAADADLNRAEAK